MTVQVRPRSDARHQLVTESWTTEPPLPVDEYVDIYGNPVKRLVAPRGTLTLRYDARCVVPDEADLDGSGVGQTLVEQIPGELLHFTLPSRYCLSDVMMATAWGIASPT